MYNSSTLKHRLAVNRSFKDLKHRRGIATTPLTKNNVMCRSGITFSLNMSSIDTPFLYLYNSKRGFPPFRGWLDLQRNRRLPSTLFQFTLRNSICIPSPIYVYYIFIKLSFLIKTRKLPLWSSYMGPFFPTYSLSLSSIDTSFLYLYNSVRGSTFRFSETCNGET